MSWQPLLALPARIMVPLLLLVLTLLAAGVNYAYQVDEYSRTVEASERDRLVERLSVEQARLEIESGLGNRQQVRRQVAALGMRPGTSHAFLVDDNGIVVAALSRTAIGRPFAEALANEPEHVRDGLLGAVGRDASRITVARAADGRALTGHAPIQPRHEFVMRVDLEQSVATRIADSRGLLQRQAATILALAVLVWGVLHLLWFRRSRLLTTTVAAIGSGRLEARSGLSGRDEIGYIGAAVDRMAEELQAHRADEARLSELINRSPVVAMEWRNLPGWPVEFISASVLQWGYARQQFMTGEIVFAQLIHPEDRPRIESEVAAHLADGPDDYRQEYRLRTADGSWIWVDDRTWLSRDDAGQVTRIHGVLLDITRQKHAEDDLRLLNQELEQRVSERTMDLEAANRELESFSYSVSHDLKAPLRGIDGYSQLLLNEYGERFDDEGRHFIANIRSGVKQMHQLIEDMLAYSRMERRAVELRPVDLAVLANAVVQGGKPKGEDKQVTVEQHVPPIEIHADREGLTLVLRNLLENAVKFSREEIETRIEVGAREEGARVLLWVRDNGIGFDMKYHDRIFDIFQRLHRAENYPGTGVGLALVKKAVQRMGGRVWAESTPGNGATFYLDLPR
jgi:PAS domain S-box-containing protein